jgi:RAB protein geranylgeranyltransferase component A
MVNVGMDNYLSFAAVGGIYHFKDDKMIELPVTKK